MPPPDNVRSLAKHLAAIPSPYTGLKEAVKAVPAVGYAQGVLGVVCVVVIIGLFKLNLFFAVLGVLLMLGLMFGLLLFAVAAKQDAALFRIPAAVMIWVFVLTVIGMLGLAVACIFWKKPIDYPSLVTQFSNNPTAQYEQKINALNDVVGAAKTEIVAANADAAQQKERADIADSKLAEKTKLLRDNLHLEMKLASSLSELIETDNSKQGKVVSDDLDSLWKFLKDNKLIVQIPQTPSPTSEIRDETPRATQIPQRKVGTRKD